MVRARHNKRLADEAEMLSSAISANLSKEGGKIFDKQIKALRGEE